MEKPSGYTVVLDATVLFPIFCSNLLLFLAERQLFQVKWSQDIHTEWINSRMRRYPDGDRAALERKRDRMDYEFEEAMVTGYESLIDDIVLPDPKDQHVLAAARKCKADVIVTDDLGHFPPAILAPLGLFAQSGDDFIADQIGVTPESEKMVAIAVVRHKKSLTRSRPTWKQYFAELARKLPHTFTQFNTASFKQALVAVLISR